MALHDKIEGGAPPMKSTSDPAKIGDAQRELGRRVREARAGARQGDIFTPRATVMFRKLLNPELRGRAGADTRTAIRDGAPAEFTLTPNATYPEGRPYATIPPNVLASLPKLPPELEFRIVDQHLILLDVPAHLVVDYLFNVMCANC